MTDLVIDFGSEESKAMLWHNLRGLSGQYLVKIKRKSKRRSIQVNRYYWGCVLAYISTETGENPVRLHETYKERFIPNIVFLDEYDLSTASLNTDEMWEYIEMIRQHALDFLNTRIPDPNEWIP